jgi:unsaturated rhamnogalacturonyl hydrolase
MSDTTPEGGGRSIRHFGGCRSAMAHGALAALGIIALAVATPAEAQGANEKFCGGTPIEWVTEVAESVTARFGNVLMFGQPGATLDYTNDLLAISLLRLAARTGKTSLRDYGETIVGSFVAEDGSIKQVPEKGFHLDVMPAGVVLIDTYERTKEEKFRKAADFMRQQLAVLPRTSEGTFSWRPNQIWLDGLWMTEPFYALYGKTFSQPANFDDILKQYRATVSHNRDPKTGLYFHGWDETHEQFWANHETGTSSSFWGRAMGWFSMSAVDTLDSVPQDHPLHAYLVQVLNDVARALVRFQDPKSGLWWQVVDQGDRPHNFTEASASAMYVYTLAKGINRGYLSVDFAPAAVRGFAGLIRDKIVRDDRGGWSVTSIVRSAGLGTPPTEWPPGAPTPSRGDTVPRGRDGSFDYYVEQPIMTNNLNGLGPFILAGVEIDGLPPSANRGQAADPASGPAPGCRFPMK